MHNWEKNRGRRDFLSSLSLNPDDVSAWMHKYDNTKLRAKSKSIHFNLTYEQYVMIAKESGLSTPCQIGRSLDKYQLGRIGDTGGYEVGNARFITMKQNLDEQRENGRSIGFDGMKGKTKETHSGIKSASEKNSRPYRFRAPNGDIVEGENLNEFCKQNGLNQGNMWSVLRGLSRISKGYTLP